jgi:actin-related protein
VAPNCAVRPKREKRLFVADQMLSLPDFSNLFYRRPHDRGFVVDWELQTQVWERLFSVATLGVRTEDARIVLTEPLFAPAGVRRATNEVLFEKFRFRAICKRSAPHLVALGLDPDLAPRPPLALEVVASSPRVAGAGAAPGQIAKALEKEGGVAAGEEEGEDGAAEEKGASDSEFDAEAPLAPPALPPSVARSCSIIVDSGFSFSHVVPVVDGAPLLRAVRRVNVGGKLLTNFLKECISYRYWNMMDETYLINHIKERLCYVSLDFERELESCRLPPPLNPVRRDYVLPSVTASNLGHVRGEREEAPPRGEEQLGRGSGASGRREAGESGEQFLPMNNERIQVPEVLFNPSDIGIHQAGVGEALLQSLAECPRQLHEALLRNIVVVGGNANLNNFARRLFSEVRAEVHTLAPVQVHTVARCAPELAPWLAGARVGTSPRFGEMCVTAAEYAEAGESVFVRKAVLAPPPPPPLAPPPPLPWSALSPKIH